ncbi:hypothetical protein HK096_005052 [Nowakowskiella sp. JEL0078]|nr:hypothetical protein HK096_005052 [Nowakowskiella sp. JEL0078]
MHFVENGLFFEPHGFFQQRKQEELRQQQLLRYQQDLESRRRYEMEERQKKRLFNQFLLRQYAEEMGRNQNAPTCDDDNDENICDFKTDADQSTSNNLPSSQLVDSKTETVKLENFQNFSIAVPSESQETRIEKFDDVNEFDSTSDSSLVKSNAALKIQRAFRSYHDRCEIQRRIEKLDALMKKLDQMIFLLERRALSDSMNLEFVDPLNSYDLVPSHKNNRSFIEYEEGLTRILVELDGVSSGGYTEVRNKRKQIVALIQGKLEQLDAHKRKEIQKFFSQ